jgi:hypothetical protein
MPFLNNNRINHAIAFSTTAHEEPAMSTCGVRYTKKQCPVIKYNMVSSPRLGSQ